MGVTRSGVRKICTRIVQHARTGTLILFRMCGPLIVSPSGIRFELNPAYFKPDPQARVVQCSVDVEEATPGCVLSRPVSLRVVPVKPLQLSVDVFICKDDDDDDETAHWQCSLFQDDTELACQGFEADVTDEMVDWLYLQLRRAESLRRCTRCENYFCDPVSTACQACILREDHSDTEDGAAGGDVCGVCLSSLIHTQPCCNAKYHPGCARELSERDMPCPNCRAAKRLKQI